MKKEGASKGKAAAEKGSKPAAKKAAAAGSSASAKEGGDGKVKRERKVYDLPGQTRDTPAEVRQAVGWSVGWLFGLQRAKVGWSETGSCMNVLVDASAPAVKQACFHGHPATRLLPPSHPAAPPLPNGNRWTRCAASTPP